MVLQYCVSHEQVILSLYFMYSSPNDKTITVDCDDDVFLMTVILYNKFIELTIRTVLSGALWFQSWIAIITSSLIYQFNIINYSSYVGLVVLIRYDGYFLLQ